jgi:hypothetical protein
MVVFPIGRSTDFVKELTMGWQRGHRSRWRSRVVQHGIDEFAYLTSVTLETSAMVVLDPAEVHMLSGGGS